MAQSSSKIVLDVEFGPIDQAKVKELGKHFSESFRKEASAEWIGLEKSIQKIKKDYDTATKEGDKISLKKTVLEQKIFTNIKKYKKIQDEINKTQFKYNKKDSDFSKKKMALNNKISKAEKDMSKFSEKDDEESVFKFNKANTDKEQAIKDLASLDIEQQQTALDYDKEAKSFLEDEIQTKSTLSQLEKEQNELSKSDVDLQDYKNGLVDKERNATKELNKLQQDRAELVSALATELKAANKEMTDEDAIKQAKQLISYDAKQTDFEKKHYGLLKKTKQARKDELKTMMMNLKLQNAALSQKGVGWLERGKIIREEKKSLMKSLGLTKAAAVSASEIGSKATEKLSDVGNEQMKGILSVVKSLSGPLLALGGIAGFVMTMLSYNKETQKARKNLLTLGLTSGKMWGNIKKDQMTGTKSMDGYLHTMESMWSRAAITNEDALAYTNDLVKSGFELSDVTSHNGDLMVEVEHMATLSGQLFGEMADITGQWTTEFNKGTKELMGTFVGLRDDASKAGIMTSRFFSSVMNAAQGMTIYGTRIEAISSAMSQLVKGTKLGQKEATSMATGLVTLNKTMNNQQKYLVMQQTGSIKKIEEERAALVKSNEEIENRQKRNKKLSKSDEKRLKSQQSRVDELSAALNVNTNEFERFVRGFEALNPADQIRASLESVFKQLEAKEGIKIDIGNTKQLKELIDKYGRTILPLLGKPFGISDEQWRLIEDLTKKEGFSFKGLGKELTEADKKRLEESASKQASIIAEGTKPIQDTIKQTIQKWIRGIYLGVEKLVAMFSDWMGKDYKISNQMKDEMEKQYTAHAEKLGQIRETSIDLQNETNEQRKKELKKQLDVYKEEDKAIRSNLQKLSEGKGKVDANTGQGLVGKVIASINPAAVTARQYAKQMLEEVKSGKTPEQIEEDRKKKEQEAPEIGGFLKGGHTGFALGGYTGNEGTRNDIAGLVHKKEFVFDAQSTKKAGPDNLNSLMNTIKSGKSSQTMDSFSMTDLLNKISQATPVAVPTAVGAAAKPSITNQVTININQKDRQEIEQIVYKVLYNDKKSGY
jgi:hypothetical protein